MHKFRRFLWLAPAALLVASLVFSVTVFTKAHAASTITVSTCDATSLDSALSTAQASSGNTINFACSGDIILDKTLFITTTLTIDGSGQSVTLDGNQALQIFAVTSGANLTLNTLTIAKGNAHSINGGGIDNSGGMVSISNSTLSNNVAASGYGGGIYNTGGTVTISNSTLSNNNAPQGGGIYNTGGTVNITTSTLSNNIAPHGGGIYNNTGGTMTISTSTLSNNTAANSGGLHTGFGGGIYNAGKVTISNSTLSGNSVPDSGGGIYNAGTVSISNSTLSNNTAYDGGGIYNYDGTGGTLSISNSTLSGNSALSSGDSIYNGGTMTSSSSIVAGSTFYSKEDCFNGGGGTITDQGYNLESGTSCHFTGTGSKQNTNPLLDLHGLQSNGGPTQTLALLDGSPAINAIPAISCSTSADQRGIARPQGPGCDIGAFEFRVPTISVPSTITTQATSPAGAVVTYSVTGTEPDDASATPTISCTPASGSTFAIGTTTVNCSASDAATPPDVTTGSFQVVVQDVAPTLQLPSTITTNATSPAGATVTYTVTATDPLYTANQLTISCTPASGSTFPIGTTKVNCSVTDPANTVVTGSFDVIVKAHAASTITVKTCDAAHLDAALSTAQASSGNTINFACSGDIILDKTLFITTTLTIDSSGHAVTLDGNHTLQVLSVNSGANLTLNALTIANGYVSCPASGGTGCGKVGAGSGGGISNSDGTVSITNSTLSGNTATGGGGGILNLFGTVSLSNSTLSGNTATGGGGILNLFGTVNLSNSTLSGNSASNGGDDIENYAGGTVNIGGSIVAENSAPSGNDCSNSGTLNDQGYNLESGTSCGFTGTGSLQNSNPKLASALANNGGPTQTLALQQGSPAIGVIPIAQCPATDQRGYVRPSSGLTACDIGAYQSQYLLHQLTPAKMLSSLANHIQTMNIANGGVKYALWLKIENAKQQVQKGHITPACNLLTAFLNQVQAQDGKALTPAQAQDLSSKAKAIQTALGC